VLKASEEAIVIDGKKALGIITPKDVIEFMMPRERESRIRIANVDRDDVLTKTIIFEALENWLKKSGIDIVYIYVYVHRHSTNGRIKYSLHTRVGTRLGMVVARSIGWDAQSSVQDLVEKLRRIVEKKHGKIMDRRRKSRKTSEI
jgi:ribosome-associated translation inhibitor RaiA